jgi:2-dehydro-3-deoxygluconokinase
VTRVVTFGEMLLRLSPPGHERLLQTPTLVAHFGGAEANVAVSLAHFGLESVYVTCLPENAIGDAAIRALRAEGVRTEHVRRGGDRMGIYFVEYGAGQRPSTVLYDRARSGVCTNDLSTLEWSRILDGAAWLHVTGITPALGGPLAVSTADAIAAARRTGMVTSLDLNYRRLLWTEGDARRVLTPIASSVDVLIANDEHLETILGIEVRDGAVEEAARQAADRFGLSLVAVTLREGRSARDTGWGAVLWDRDRGALHVGHRYDVDIVDRIGAGDAFAAGLIYAVVSRRDPGAALQFAVAAGALKHTIPGDFNRVSVTEVDQLVAGNAAGRMTR